jgi:hypothetical protein
LQDKQSITDTNEAEAPKLFSTTSPYKKKMSSSFNGYQFNRAVQQEIGMIKGKAEGSPKDLKKQKVKHVAGNSNKEINF